eukprot:TRINITY_DN1160_c2_g1_i1.p1 TRINITY_DN1160_c2_g1~~TRINITY_DN1160_c2_g1_i1.p1  ORF type:complete len:151 (-),score=52.55 TRINITY_DN1160_c2_g1_i1:57-452(-)
MLALYKSYLQSLLLFLSITIIIIILSNSQVNCESLSLYESNLCTKEASNCDDCMKANCTWCQNPINTLESGCYRNITGVDVDCKQSCDLGAPAILGIIIGTTIGTILAVASVIFCFFNIQNWRQDPIFFTD